MDFVRHRVAHDLEELAASADVQPPLDMPAAHIFAGVHIRRERLGARIRGRPGQRRVTAVTKFGFVACATPGAFDSEHAASRQCAYGNGPMPRSSTVRPDANRSRSRWAANGCGSPRAIR